METDTGKCGAVSECGRWRRPGVERYRVDSTAWKCSGQAETPDRLWLKPTPRLPNTVTFPSISLQGHLRNNVYPPPIPIPCITVSSAADNHGHSKHDGALEPGHVSGARWRMRGPGSQVQDQIIARMWQVQILPLPLAGYQTLRVPSLRSAIIFSQEKNMNNNNKHLKDLSGDEKRW